MVAGMETIASMCTRARTESACNVIVAQKHKTLKTAPVRTRPRRPQSPRTRSAKPGPRKDYPKPKGKTAEAQSSKAPASADKKKGKGRSKGRPRSTSLLPRVVMLTLMRPRKTIKKTLMIKRMGKMNKRLMKHTSRMPRLLKAKWTLVSYARLVS